MKKTLVSTNTRLIQLAKDISTNYNAEYKHVLKMLDLEYTLELSSNYVENATLNTLDRVQGWLGTMPNTEITTDRLAKFRVQYLYFTRLTERN